jgi:hypothetical protein
MAAAKKKCASCGDGFIGRSNARFCSPTCRKRASRGQGSQNRDTVTVSAISGRRQRSQDRSSKAQAVLRSLDEQLARVGEESGEPIEWSPQEQFQLDLLADEIDRTVDLAAMYEECGDDVKLRVKLSAELRLLRQSTARMIREIKTDLPERPTPATRKARRAANARWRRGGGGDAAS